MGAQVQAGGVEVKVASYKQGVVVVLLWRETPIMLLKGAERLFH